MQSPNNYFPLFGGAGFMEISSSTHATPTIYHDTAALTAADNGRSVRYFSASPVPTFLERSSAVDTTEQDEEEEEEEVDAEAEEEFESEAEVESADDEQVESGGDAETETEEEVESDAADE
jgi:hypothetical protein